MLRQFLALTLFGLVSVEALHAQDPDFVLLLTDSVVVSGEPGTASVVLDHFGTAGVQGWSLGVEHDPSDATLVDVAAGETILDLSPDFFATTVFADGWTAAVIFTASGSVTIPPGASYELHRPSYDLAPGVVNTTLCFTDTLGTPPTPTVVVVGARQLVPTQVCGTITAVDATGFRRGDANGDGVVDIADPLFLEAELFAGGSASPCRDASDANDDGFVDIADDITILSYLFIGGATPPAPGPLSCGADPTDSDPLDCGAYDCP